MSNNNFNSSWSNNNNNNSTGNNWNEYYNKLKLNANEERFKNIYEKSRKKREYNKWHEAYAKRQEEFRKKQEEYRKKQEEYRKTQNSRQNYGRNQRYQRQQRQQRQQYYKPRPIIDPNLEALKVLGLNQSATWKQIRKAYHKKVLKNHPNKGGNANNFRKVQEAYELLEKSKYKKKGGSQFIHIPNYGKRKLRYQKNGRVYVIVNGKKLKL